MHHHYEAFFFTLSGTMECNQGTRRARVPWQEIPGTHHTHIWFTSWEEGEGWHSLHRASLLGVNVFETAEMFLERDTFQRAETESYLVDSILE